MATRNIVPRADGEGCIGTESKKWQSVNTKKVNAESVNSTDAVIEKVSANTITSTDLTIINGITTLQRNKAYEVGDIAYSKNLPSWAYLECTTAGTTGASEPDFSSVSTSGGAIADGSVQWIVRTICAKDYVDTLNNSLSNKIDNLFKIEYICIPWNTTEDSINISAPDKDGYNFFCWLSITSNGRVKLVYTNGITNKNTIVFTPNGTEMNGMSIDCFALYIKK